MAGAFRGGNGRLEVGVLSDDLSLLRKEEGKAFPLVTQCGCRTSAGGRCVAECSLKFTGENSTPGFASGLSTCL